MCGRILHLKTAFKRPDCTTSIWSSLKPLRCAPFNFAFAWHALSCSSWVPQSLANLISESMGFSHYNNKSVTPIVAQASSILEQTKDSARERFQHKLSDTTTYQEQKKISCINNISWLGDLKLDCWDIAMCYWRIIVQKGLNEKTIKLYFVIFRQSNTHQHNCTFCEHVACNSFFFFFRTLL